MQVLRLLRCAFSITVLLFSGLLVNLIQFFALLFLYPCFKKAYRVVNRYICALHWSQLVHLLENWAQVRLSFSGDTFDPYLEQTHQHESIICMSNHRSNIDWLAGMALAYRQPNGNHLLGGVRAIAKSSWAYIPVLGWMFWLCEMIFIARSWEKDQVKLAAGFSALRSQTPFWLVIFVEGTRFTKSKQEANQKYAKENNLPVLQHVLLPRAKAFASAVMSLRARKFQQQTSEDNGVLNAVYDLTIAFEKAPSLLDVFGGKKSQSDESSCGGSVSHVHVRRIPIQDIPESEADISSWLINRYQIKDTVLDTFYKTGVFPSDAQIRAIETTFSVNSPVVAPISLPPKSASPVFYFWSFALSCFMLYLALFTPAWVMHALPYVGFTMLSLVAMLGVTIFWNAKSSQKGGSSKSRSSNFTSIPVSNSPTK